MRFGKLPALLAVCHLLPLGASALITVGVLDRTGASTNGNDVEVVGDLAYVADDRYSGLRIIDVSDPTFPVELGALDTPGYARDVEVVGDLAYVVGNSSAYPLRSAVRRW